MKGTVSTTQHIVVFQVAGLACALRLESVAEIVPMAALFSPPSRPALIEGFLNLGGAAIPVVRLDRLFGLPEREVELYTPMIVIKSKSGPLALWVERVLDVRVIDASSILAVEPRHSFNGCVKAVVGTETFPVHLLAVERILLDKERQCLAEFQSREQQRLLGLQSGGTPE